MIISLTAISGSYNYQYSLQPAGGDYNPWAVPQAAENLRGFQQPLKYKNQQYQGRSSQNRIYRGGRFVTPQFLESLKRQQTQQQIMPENSWTPQFAPGQSMPQQPGSDLPGSGSFGYPSYGMDYLDPSYDMPAVTPWSPWGIGTDTW